MFISKREYNQLKDIAKEYTKFQDYTEYFKKEIETYRKETYIAFISNFPFNRNIYIYKSKAYSSEKEIYDIIDSQITLAEETRIKNIIKDHCKRCRKNK